MTLRKRMLFFIIFNYSKLLQDLFIHLRNEDSSCMIFHRHSKEK